MRAKIVNFCKNPITITVASVAVISVLGFFGYRYYSDRKAANEATELICESLDDMAELERLEAEGM